MADNEFVKTSIQKPEEKPAETAPQADIPKATIRKKSLGQRLLGSFISEDIPSLLTDVWQNILVPKVKSFFIESLETAFDMKGSARNGGRTDYNAMSRPTVANGGQRVYSSNGVVLRKPIEDIMLYDEQTVLRLFSDLREYIRTNGFVTLGYLYRKLGLPSDQSKENYGWYELPDIRYTKGYDERGQVVYIPQFPNPVWVRA